MKAMFIGDPRNDGDGPKVLMLHGVAFPKNEWVDPVPSALEGKLAGNSHFVTKEGELSAGLAMADPDHTRAAVVAAAFPDLVEPAAPAAVEGDPAPDVVEPASDAYPHLTDAQVEALDRDGDQIPGGSNASDEKAALIAQLEAMGVEFDRRLGVAKLKALVDEQKFIKGED
ncbi:hypothetical protein [Phenylobacterium sp.]|uniref:hypothetical protein n=1 Tax=Phenylobacterium sp. TaxID=1871053 RepID=UPI00272FF4DE|nr:hypothetical protein [Phenylobacterium sp.]MDP1873640.1 hypothetical protein [Phenylobacterium sp.]